MNDQSNPKAQKQIEDPKPGRVGHEAQQDQTGKRASTPSDKGTPRVDQGHNKAKDTGEESTGTVPVQDRPKQNQGGRKG